jgi:hypothetical protein
VTHYSIFVIDVHRLPIAIILLQVFTSEPLQ